MTVYELSTDEMLELKQHYLTLHLLEVEDREPSLYELCQANEIVDDWIIFDVYSHCVFSHDDFFCNE